MTGGDTGFKRLFRQRYRTIFRYIYLRVSDREQAEDLASEVFLLAYEKRHRAATHSMAWLITCSRNLIGNAYQRRDTERDRIVSVLQEELEELAATGAGSDADLEVRQALLTLKPLDALALQLTYWDGLNATEAAKVLDCSTPAYWARLSRARRAMREALDWNHSPAGPNTSAPRQKGAPTHG